MTSNGSVLGNAEFLRSQPARGAYSQPIEQVSGFDYALRDHHS